MNLNEMEPGERGVIKRIEASGVILQRLYDLGFFPGVRVAVNRNGPFKDPMECSVDGRRVSVRRSEVKGVEVTLE